MTTSKFRLITAALIAGVLTVTVGAASAATDQPHSSTAASVDVTAVVTPDQTIAAIMPAGTADPTEFVNPFMATQHDHGQGIPGAFAPSGLVKASPVTYPKRAHGGYDYAQNQMTGFVHTNTDGAGGNGAGGDFLVVPTSVEYTQRPQVSSYVKSFNHNNEHAEPGYYQVGLAATQGMDGVISSGTGTINAELAALQRTGVDRYTFPAPGRANLVIDLNNNFDRRIVSAVTTGTTSDGRAKITGELVGVHGGNYRLYFYAETSLPAARIQTWDDSGALADADGTVSQRGWDNGVILGFDLTQANQAVTMAVTFSGISVAQAERDQRAELTAARVMAGQGTNQSSPPITNAILDTARQATHKNWKDLLGRVDVTATSTADPTGELREIFYTSLYRMHGAPVDVTSTDGTYRGGDGVIYPADGRVHYDSWSTWDDFRKYAVFSVLYPERFADMAQSKVDMFAQVAQIGATSPRNLIHAVPGVRWERSAVVIADAVAKGFTLERLDEAYPALAAYSSAYGNINSDPARDYVADRAGVTVEASYDDWAMATIAQAIGKPDEAQRYLNRAEFYRNLVKPGAWASGGTQVGVLTPRNAAGAWASADLEKFEGNNPYQGSLWQYHWYGTHDMAGLFDQMGGVGAAQLALSHFFGEQAPTNCARMLHSNANEVDLHTPYLFNYVGQPAKTQKWVREIYTAESCNRYVATTENIAGSHNNGEFLNPRKMRVYKNEPDGLLPTMDDDHGTMSAMFVTAALGLFPVTQGSDQFQIGTPFFDQVKITRTTGDEFTITANGVSPSNYYIQSATLGSAALNNTWLTYQSLAGAGSLTFNMVANPSTWGEGSAAAYSMSDSTTRLSATDSQAAKPTGPETVAQVRTRLGRLVAEVEPANQGPYTSQSFAMLTGARLAAVTAMADGGTSRSHLLTVAARLSGAVDGLVIEEGILKRFEAESSHAWSGGQLKNEANNSGGDLGGVENGSWVRYNVPPTGGPQQAVTPTGIQVRYANPSGNAYHNASVEVRAGTASGPIVGTLALPPTGTSWADYRVASGTLTNPEALASAQQVTFVFKGSTPSGRQWVSNVDWFQFTGGAGGGGAAVPANRVPLTAHNHSEAGQSRDGTALQLTSDPYKIQNIKDGAWLKYAAGSDAAKSAIKADRISVRYEKPTTRAPQNSWIEIRRGSLSAPNSDRIDLTYTDSSQSPGWGSFGTVQISVDPARYNDAADIYVVFHSTGHNSDRPFVANVVSLRFDSSPDVAALNTAYQVGQSALADANRRLPAYVAVLRRELAVAHELRATAAQPHGTVSQGEVDAATWRVTRATAQVNSLTWTPPPGEGGPGDGSPDDDTPGVKALASIAATVTTPRFRKRAKVRVAVTAPTASAGAGSTAPGAYPTGIVRVTKGTKLLGSAALVRGAAIVKLPAKLKVGRHQLVVTYVPSAGVAVSTASTRLVLRVRKALPKVRLMKSSNMRVGRRATLRVRVNKVGAAKPKGGKVRVLVAGKRVGTAKVLKRKKGWIAVVKTKRLKKPGKVKVRFMGKGALAKRTVTVKARVRR